MAKLVIFDWDGTLFDSIGRICVAMLAAGEQAGAAPRQSQDVQNIIGLSLDVAIDVIWPNESVATQAHIAECYKAIYVASDQTPPTAYPGVLSLLDDLYAERRLLAVATGKTRRGLDRVMGLTNTEQYFSATRCADEAESKPSPAMLFQLLETLGVSVNDAIMVGDTEYDLLMAKNAGMRSVGVSYGAHSVARLRECSPIAILDNLQGLKEYL